MNGAQFHSFILGRRVTKIFSFLDISFLMYITKWNQTLKNSPWYSSYQSLGLTILKEKFLTANEHRLGDFGQWFIQLLSKTFNCLFLEIWNKYSIQQSP